MTHRMAHRIVDWAILILVVLVVPLTHGSFEYVGLIVVGLLLVTINHVIARKRMKAADSK
jgi:hypothetical protein